MNLDTYFQRISYTGPRENTLAVLQDLHRLHPQAIAFEGLSAFLGTGVSLAPEDVFEKLVIKGRGGYCFEHNQLFASALKALGFDVTEHAARVLWRSPDKTQMARTHMLLRVLVDGEPWIADVGFGGLTMTAALRLEAGQVQSTPHEEFIFSREGDEWTISANLGDRWQTMYVFDLVSQYPADFEMANFFVAEHPQSLFRHNLMLGKAFPGGRHAMQNREYSRYETGGDRQHRTIHDASEFMTLLEDAFGIQVQDNVDADLLSARFEALE